MPLFDLTPAELQDYLPDRHEPADFQDFWSATLADTRRHPLDVRLAPHGLELPLVEAQDVWFSGFGGHRVHALLLRPRWTAKRTDTTPAVVQYLGYGDGSGTPLDWLALPVAGFVTLVVDTRGQGARARRAGQTGDAGGSASPHVEGFLTQGILDPSDYYYRRVFADAVRAVEVTRGLDGVDPGRIAVAGTSQGGGIALAASALLADDVAATMVNVPFLCDMSRAIEVTDKAPYSELLKFVRTHRQVADQALGTLTYFDGMTMAAHGRAPALFSVALMDEVCPPSTVYAAYNHYAGPKDLEVYRYNEHEGGGVAQDELAIHWFRSRLGHG